MSLHHWVAGLHLSNLFSVQPVSNETTPEQQPEPQQPEWKNIEEPPDGPNYIATLPPELLAHTFSLSLPSRRFPTQVPFEVTLSHVSEFWRDVALNTPNLWTKINIYSPRSSGLITEYLRRSGQRLLLDIDIDTYTFEKSTATMLKKQISLAEALSKELAPQVSRIRNLSFFCYFKITPTVVLSGFPQSSALCLQRFVVKYDSPTHPASSNVPQAGRVPIFENGSPHLSFLETDLPDVLPSTSSLRNLTTLCLHSLDESSQHTYASFVEVLTAPHSLLYLSVQGTIKLNSWPMHQGGPTFELSKLKALRLLDDGLMAAKMLLSMCAPDMESLWLDFRTREFTSFFDSPQMTMAVGLSKFRALKYLTIPNDNFRALESFAKAFPTITHLHLPHPVFWQADQLQKALKTHWAFVHTIVISMTRESRLESLYSALNEILPHRRRTGHPIQTLLIDKDLFGTMARNAPKIIKQVNAEAVSPQNYHEIWWNKVDRLEQ
ncbi:hypothetical protein CPB84DRAFT_921431 [Gymnopilus junonius]|uniref:F-box domain-containing protein n=1 Tax=Gymnopilus junonius TaxID=109634 RepID=A0A9P5P0I9_GYMJU|nr:hypothetical protein CPB84DRAFT_921431 [Gymnopilus junonius]